MIRLKFERLQRGWNQATLAARSGVSAAEISKIEVRRLVRPYEWQLRRLSDALGVPSDRLLDNITADDFAGAGRAS